jgi:hypothetical protein
MLNMYFKLNGAYAPGSQNTKFNLAPRYICSIYTEKKNLRKKMLE